MENKNLELVREIVQKLADGIIILDEEGIIRFANPAACLLFGLCEEELVGDEFGYPSVAEDMTELDILSKSGKPVPVELRTEIINWDGDDRRLVSLREISGRKEAEQLRYELRFQKTVTEISLHIAQTRSRNLDDAIPYILERTGKFFKADRSYLFLFSEDGHEMVYADEWCRTGIESVKEKIGSFDTESLPWFAKRIRETKGVQFFDIDQLPEEAEAEKILFQGLGINSRSCVSFTIKGSVAGFVGLDYVGDRERESKHRLSQLKTVANIIENAIALQRAESANREKSLFLSNMSHEIRTPLNAILGFAQILERDSSLSSRQKEQVRSINRSGRLLLELINDILDISKIEAGMAELNPEVFCLHQLLDDIEVIFRSKAKEKGLQFAFERGGNIPYNVYADEGKLRRIFINLISNAIKFTVEGRVAVRVKAESAGATGAEEDGSEENAVRLICEVEDTGPGISEKEQDDIFDIFAQGEAGANRGGTGLGLGISRKLVEMMDGELSVESEVGEGSFFRFDVRLTPTGEEPVKGKESESRRIVGFKPTEGQRRILIVDDDESNRDMLGSLLRPFGFEVREAKNGREALEACREWAPHAVLMDMRMPVMDGYEATRRLRDEEAFRKVPVIAITASVFKEERDSIFSAGASELLTKPILTEELYRVLGECMDLECEYADEPDEQGAHSESPSLTPESVAQLPGELIEEMREAVEEGFITRLEELIGQVEELDEQIARGLKALADEFDYAGLNKVLNVKNAENE